MIYIYIIQTHHVEVIRPQLFQEHFAFPRHETDGGLFRSGLRQRRSGFTLYIFPTKIGYIPNEIAIE